MSQSPGLQETLEPGSTAAVLVWESVRAPPFGFGGAEVRWPARGERPDPDAGV